MSAVFAAHPCKLMLLAFAVFVLALAGSHYSHHASPPPIHLPPTAGTQILTFNGIEVDRRVVRSKPEMLFIYGSLGNSIMVVISRDHTTGILEGFEVEHLLQWEAEGPWEVQLKHPFDPQTSAAVRYKASHPTQAK